MCLNENSQIKGAIFDLDGTVIDSMELWLDIDREFFEKRGLTVPHDYQKTIAHLGLKECAKYTKNTYCPSENEKDLIAEWQSMCLCRYKGKDSARFIKPFAAEYLKRLKERGIKLAVATANSPKLFEPILKNNNLYDLFDAFTTVDEVEKNKSHPDIFLKSAEKLCLKAEDCEVYEDSIIAIRTAKSIGMKTVGVYDKSAKELVPELKRCCDKFIYGFSELL